MNGMDVTVLHEYFITENLEKNAVLVIENVLGALERVFSNLPVLRSLR